MADHQDQPLPPKPGPERPNPLPPELQVRIADDLAAGRTVALPRDVLVNPELRGNLPAMIESLQPKERPTATALQIPGYRIVCELGQGGMSTVYLAVQERLNRHVALKVVPHWLGGGERARQRLHSEARALAQLAHPNIVAVHDIVQQGDLLAIAMDWIDGLSLAELLRLLPGRPDPLDVQILHQALGSGPGQGAPPDGSAAEWFARRIEQVARAVHHVHEHQLLHLDIKPSNIMVRRDGTPLLADFGVARELGATWAHTRSFAGTPIYAAPEQLRCADREIGPQTDVYGLGMTLYELLARRNPLREQQMSKVLQDIHAGRLPPLRSLTDVPEPLANIAHRAIAPLIGDRYPTAAAFADDLRAFLDHRQVAARPTSWRDRVRWWVHAEPWLAALVAVLLVALTAGSLLGARLWRELPRIHTLDQAALAKQIAEDVGLALQMFLVSTTVPSEHIARLQETFHNHPTHPDLFVALVTVFGWQDPPRSLAVIDAAEQAGLVSPGTRLARRRIAEGRWYFTAEEVRELHSSQIEVDILLRLVDRVLWAENSMAASDFAVAAADLEREVQATTPKSLLHGLRAYVAARSGDRKGLDTSCYALAKNWPEDPSAVAWQATAWDEIDRRRARALLEEHLARHPEDHRACLLLARSHDCDGNGAEMLAALERIGAGPEHLSLALRRARAKSLALLGRKDEAQRELDAVAKDKEAARLNALQVMDPAAAQAAYEAGLTDGSLDLAGVVDAMAFAVRLQNPAFIELAARHGMARFPEYLPFRWRLAEVHWRSKEYAEAALLIRNLEPPQAMLNNYAPYLALVWRSERDWLRLRDLAELWLERHTEWEYAAEYHLGVALSRLGQREAARGHLERHLELGSNRIQSSPRARIYKEAALELLWLDLDPRHPDQERRQRAAAELDRDARRDLQALARSKAFWSLVLAELLLTEGNRAAASSAMERARQLRTRDGLDGAPSDLDARLLDLEQRLTSPASGR